MDLDHLKKLVDASLDEETDGPEFEKLLAYLAGVEPCVTLKRRIAKALDRLPCSLCGATDWQEHRCLECSTERMLRRAR